MPVDELKTLMTLWEVDALFCESTSQAAAYLECCSGLQKLIEAKMNEPTGENESPTKEHPPDDTKPYSRPQHILFLDGSKAHLYDMQCRAFAQIDVRLPSELHAIVVEMDAEAGVPMVEFTPEVVLALERIPTAWGRYDYLESVEMSLHGEESPGLYLVT